MSVTAIGSVALDTLHLPTGHHPDVLGGSASHFATACRHFCKSIALVGVVGKDFPLRHVDYFKTLGVDLSGLEFAEGKTFRWSGRYEEAEMSQAITLETQLNVFETFRPKLSQAHCNTEYLFLGNIHPSLQFQVAGDSRSRVKILDTMNLWIHTTRELLLQTLRRVDVLIFNEKEARDLSGKGNLIDAGKAVIEIGPKVVIIKRGEHGALLVSKDDIFSIPGFPVSEVKDPTGAGDSFAGGFVGYLAEAGDFKAENLRRAVAYGNVMGSFNVEGVGTEVLAKVTRQEIDQRFKNFQQLVSF